MPQPFFVLDATKSVPLSQLTPEIIGQWNTLSATAPLTPAKAFSVVSVLHRAVDVRAKAVASVPFKLFVGNGTTDQAKTARYQSFIQHLRKLLYLNEASLCLYGSAYWLIDTNAAGRNPTPRWLLPSSIEPQYDTQQGVKGFKRTVGGDTINLDMARVVYWWTPNLTAEVGPGQSPAQAALAGAGVLHHLDTFLSGFFERGAIKAMMLLVDGNPTTSDRQLIKSTWRRMFTGVARAFNVEIFSQHVKPVPVGDSLKETINPQMTTQAREDVLTALGVPHSLVLSNAANFATASQDAYNFYLQTVMPEVDTLILPALNDWLATLNLRLDPDYGQMEIFQQQLLAQAQAVQALVGEPVLTVDEGRSIIGYGPRPEPAPVPTPQPVPVPAPEPVPDSEDAAVRADMTRWERKALKRLKEHGKAACAFDSEHIGPAAAAAIARQLEHATTADAVRNAFKARAKRVRASDVDTLTGDLLERAARLAAEARE